MFGDLNKVIGAVFIAAGVAASGCSSSSEARAARERNPAPCPNIVVLSEAARQIEFASDQLSADNIAYTAEISNVALSCRYFSDKPISASVSVDLAFGRGPKGEEREKEFTYFVAITRKDLEIISKKEFTVPVKFGEKQAVKQVEEEINKIIIPRRDENVAGSNFEVVVGLAVTPRQINFNRSGKSLKFPEL